MIVIPIKRVHDTRIVYCVKGDYHRLDGPAIEWNNGDKKWYKNGKLHREDGPAVEYNNVYKEWWVNGVRHRIDGPAIVRSKRGKKCWYINGKLLTNEITQWFRKTGFNTDYEHWTLEEKVQFKLIWG